ncbi:STE3-domain-containing protein [Peniophora sp. CONT]|nr:STE3-domain-containing protein [Peniophora sp. CONT]
MQSQTPTYPLVPTANFIACFLTLSVLLTSPLRQAFNRGVCLLSAWVSVMALVTGIQAVIWRKSADTTLLPGFCDISIRLQIGSVSAETACTLIITRYLFRVVQHPLRPIDQQERRRRMLLNYLLIAGLPIVTNVLYYVVQNSRFQVVEEFGCLPTIEPSGLAILVLNGIPTIFIIISAVYMTRTILILCQHKRNLQRLFGNQSIISRSVYLRIFSFGFILLLFCAAAAVNFFPLPHEFYPGWSVVHKDWDPVSVTAEEWRSQGVFVFFTIVWYGWYNVFLAVIIFGLFGLTHDARAAYMRVYDALRSRSLHRRRPQSELSTLPLAYENRLSTLSDIGGLSLDSTLMGPLSLDGSVARKESISIDIAIAVERCMSGDMESSVEHREGRDESQEVAVEV